MVDSPEFLPPALPAPKRRRVPRKVRQAIELIVSGACRRKRAAAERVGMRRETLSRWLNSVEGLEALHMRARHEVALSQGRAAARLRELIDSTSQKVALEATKFSLQTASIGSPKDPAININIANLPRAGYVIDLREPGQPEMKVVGGAVIDAKAEPVDD